MKRREKNILQYNFSIEEYCDSERERERERERKREREREAT